MANPCRPHPGETCLVLVLCVMVSYMFLSRCCCKIIYLDMMSSQGGMQSYLLFSQFDSDDNSIAMIHG